MHVKFDSSDHTVITSILFNFNFIFFFFIHLQVFKKSTYSVPLVASLISGIFLSIGMTPFDVVATRLFNQGWFCNSVDESQIDCLLK